MEQHHTDPPCELCIRGDERARLRREEVEPLREALRMANTYVAAWAESWRATFQTGREITIEHQDVLNQIAAALRAADERGK